MVVGELLGIVSNFLFPKRTAGPKRMIHSPVEQWLGGERGVTGSLSWSPDDHCPATNQPTSSAMRTRREEQVESRAEGDDSVHPRAVMVRAQAD